MIAPVSEQDVADICASFQNAIADTLKDRVVHGVWTASSRVCRSVAIRLLSSPAVSLPTDGSGDIAELCDESGFRFVAPPLELCTDNAAMIAWAGVERIRAGWSTKAPSSFAALALAVGHAYANR